MFYMDEMWLPIAVYSFLTTEITTAGGMAMGSTAWGMTACEFWGLLHVAEWNERCAARIFYGRKSSDCCAVRIFLEVDGSDCVSFKVLFRLDWCRSRTERIFSECERVECSAARVFPAWKWFGGADFLLFPSENGSEAGRWRPFCSRLMAGFSPGTTLRYL